MYVVAVSGGVDSVVLLHILAQQGLPLVVAHFDHGIRPDSASDRRFVGDLARGHEARFEYTEGRLGPRASEAAARQARYEFLHGLRRQHGARAVVTAHHADDVLETAVLNILRGTGRRGLSSLRSTDDIYRPLLRTPKDHIIAYARQHGLEWREDSTNTDTDYLRNHVRLRLLPRLDEAARTRLAAYITGAQRQNDDIDGMLQSLLGSQPAADRLERQWFVMLPHTVGREVMAAWLRGLGIRGYDRRGLERLVVAAKVLAPGKRADVDGKWSMLVRRDELVLIPR
jgi:tRNA(Ile)-lysidine synthetase-like protein